MIHNQSPYSSIYHYERRTSIIIINLLTFVKSSEFTVTKTNEYNTLPIINQPNYYC